MSRKLRKPDRALYVLPTRRMVEDQESEQGSPISDIPDYNNAKININVNNYDIDDDHHSSVHAARTVSNQQPSNHRHQRPECSPNRSQRRVTMTPDDQVNGHHKILSDRLNNERPPYGQHGYNKRSPYKPSTNNKNFSYRKQRNISSSVPKDPINSLLRNTSNEDDNNKTPNSHYQKIVRHVYNDQTTDAEKVPSDTLNNKYSPSQKGNISPVQVSGNYVSPRQQSGISQPYSSHSVTEVSGVASVGRGRLLSLMGSYLKKESDLKAGNNRTTHTYGPTVIHKEQAAPNNCPPVPIGGLRNKRENPKILGMGRARSAKRSNLSQRVSERVSPNTTKIPDITVGQFDSCNEEEKKEREVKQQTEMCSVKDNVPCSTLESSSVPEKENSTETNTVKTKSFSWAEEMREFDKLHLKDDNCDNYTNNDVVELNYYNNSSYVTPKSAEKENRFYDDASPNNNTSRETHEISPNINQYLNSESRNRISPYAPQNSGEKENVFYNSEPLRIHADELSMNENRYLDTRNNNARRNSKNRINPQWSNTSHNSVDRRFKPANKLPSGFVSDGNQTSPNDLRHKINSFSDNDRTPSPRNRRTPSPTDKQTIVSPYRHEEINGKIWQESFLSRCSAADYKFIDTHCHLDRIFDDVKNKSDKMFTNFQEFKEANELTFPKEFAGCVTVFCDPWKFDPKGSLLHSFDNTDNVWIAMGCHPKKVKQFTEDRRHQLKESLTQIKSIVAVGEIGLDYSGTFHQQMEEQQEALRHQIKLAIELRKPIIIHCRDAEEDCLRILQEDCPQNWPIHLHCYTNYYKFAQKWLNNFPNLYIGLTPKVTYKSSTALHDTALKIPLDRLLLETDAPYFIPSMVPHNGMLTSHPAMAFSVAETVAKLKNISVQQVLEACLDNTLTLYGIRL
ncbi:putative deoxyribonuclease TATDN2 [Argonauta hians]